MKDLFDIGDLIIVRQDSYNIMRHPGIYYPKKMAKMYVFVLTSHRESGNLTLKPFFEHSLTTSRWTATYNMIEIKQSIKLNKRIKNGN